MFSPAATLFRLSIRLCAVDTRYWGVVGNIGLRNGAFDFNGHDTHCRGRIDSRHAL